MKMFSSRREFLRKTGVAVSAAMLGACASQPPAEIPATATAKPVPSPTPIPPTPTEQAAIHPISLEMILAESGSFKMGSDQGNADEQPVHTVRITKPFQVAKYAVTFEQYDQLCDEAPQVRRPDRAVQFSVQSRCNALSHRLTRQN